MNLTLRYSCALCGLDDVPLLAPGRGTEDIGRWMDQTVLLVARDHKTRSPGCPARSLTQLKIPYNGGRVGAPRAH